jgi:inner membrane protease ATP23
LVWREAVSLFVFFFHSSPSERKEESFVLSMASSGKVKPVHEDPKEASKLCNQWVENGLTKNKVIQFLVQNLVDNGCTPPAHFIRCMSCDQPAAGGFGMLEEDKEQCNRTKADMQSLLSREKSGASALVIKPEIFLCEQYMESELMTHKTMVHELIHAIDMCRTKMDPLHNCVHMACTEIRAENLSGECSFFKEFLRMKSFAGHGQECVKRRAILSVRANPNCAARAEDYVDAAMYRCFQDVYPFDRHPNQQ